MRVATEAEVGRDGREQEGVEDQVVEVEEPARPGEGEDPVVDGRRARAFAEQHEGSPGSRPEIPPRVGSEVRVWRSVDRANAMPRPAGPPRENYGRAPP